MLSRRHKACRPRLCKVVVAGFRCYVEDTKPVNQDLGKVDVGRCRCSLEDTKLVNQDWGNSCCWGGADVI